MRIEDEIKQSSFSSIYQKAHINILFTAAWLNLHVLQCLKPFGLTPQQFNVLRILRGSRPKPLNIKEITERMIDKSSNASRLVDKLLDKNMVRKTISQEDARQVQIHITDVGLATLAKASSAIEQNLTKIFSSLTEAEANQLSDLLDKLRG